MLSLPQLLGTMEGEFPAFGRRGAARAYRNAARRYGGVAVGPLPLDHVALIAATLCMDAVTVPAAYLNSRHGARPAGERRLLVDFA